MGEFQTGSVDDSGRQAGFVWSRWDSSQVLGEIVLNRIHRPSPPGRRCSAGRGVVGVSTLSPDPLTGSPGSHCNEGESRWV